MVLIESDWNLKLFIGQFGIFHHMRINRIRLEFKGRLIAWTQEFLFGINRIRLEFKGRTDLRRVTGRTGINRIRLEFKDDFIARKLDRTFPVLIESDWNLKQYGHDLSLLLTSVLIESDWNLKENQQVTQKNDTGY